MKEKLARAGYRGQGPLVTFMFFRFLMPPVVFVGALIYLFGIAHLAWPFDDEALASRRRGARSAIICPTSSSATASRRAAIPSCAPFPTRSTCMLICVESGMSIEAAFNRVAPEVGTQSVELAEELGLTTAELSYLPDRRQAFENLAERCGHSGVKAVAAALIQSEKYGTPMGQALRVTAQENREMRMAEAERKAARAARQAHRADDRVLPALSVRGDPGPRRAQGHGPHGVASASARGRGKHGRHCASPSLFLITAVLRGRVPRAHPPGSVRTCETSLAAAPGRGPFMTLWSTGDEA